MKPVHETREREVCYTVCKPVKYTKTIQCRTGRWETQVCEKPGPVVTKCVQEPGCWVWDPCKCRCVYVPGQCKQVQIQCPPIRVCKKVWVPEIVEKEVECTKYVRETCVKKVPYTVCRMVPEQRVKTCTYRVCKMVREQRVKQVPYTVCKPVCYEKTIQCVQYVPRKVAYTVTRCVPRVVCTQVPVKVCCPVPRCCKPACEPACCEPVANATRGC